VLMTLLDTLKIDLREVLHGEQRFDYHSPVCAGDTLRFQTRVSDIYDKKGGALEFVVNDTKVTNQLGEHVSDLHSVIVVRHA
jgi:acyl dehydratase